MNRILLAAFALVFVAMGTARADRAFSPLAFFPDRNDRVHVSVETDSYWDIPFAKAPATPSPIFRWRKRCGMAWRRRPAFHSEDFSRDSWT